jgi:hypothetical protein
MKKLSVICLLVLGIILISGCTNGEKTNSKTSTSSQSSMNETPKETSASPSILLPSDNYSSTGVPEISQPELIPGEFDINITSYYFVFQRGNHVIYEDLITMKQAFDPVEKNYVIYHLTIKNNDTNTLDFSINKLQLHTGGQVFAPAYPGTTLIYPGDFTYVLSEMEKENRLNDTLLLPHQILEGIVIFQVDNYTTLFDRSFSLRYNATPIRSTSYEKSFEALTIAEQFDYSIAFDMPPYDNHLGGYYSYYPEPESNSVWANWVNRSVFEYYKKHDEMTVPKEESEYLPNFKIAYAVKVIPEQDLTVFHKGYYIMGGERTSGPWQITGEITSEEQYKGTLYVVDDTGEEIFNKSIDSLNDDNGLVILDNQTYRHFSKDIPQMIVPHATIVHFSFYSTYGWPLSMRLTFNNQDIILDGQHNITLARYDNIKMVS